MHRIHVRSKRIIGKLEDYLSFIISFPPGREENKHLDKIKVYARTFLEIYYAFFSRGKSTIDNSVPFSLLH